MKRSGEHAHSIHFGHIVIELCERRWEFVVVQKLGHKRTTYTHCSWNALSGRQAFSPSFYRSGHIFYFGRSATASTPDTLHHRFAQFRFCIERTQHAHTYTVVQRKNAATTSNKIAKITKTKKWTRETKANKIALVKRFACIQQNDFISWGWRMRNWSGRLSQYDYMIAFFKTHSTGCWSYAKCLVPAWSLCIFACIPAMSAACRSSSNERRNLTQIIMCLCSALSICRAGCATVSCLLYGF